MDAMMDCALMNAISNCASRPAITFRMATSRIMERTTGSGNSGLHFVCSPIEDLVVFLGDAFVGRNFVSAEVDAWFRLVVEVMEIISSPHQRREVPRSF